MAVEKSVQTNQMNFDFSAGAETYLRTITKVKKSKSEKNIDAAKTLSRSEAAEKAAGKKAKTSVAATAESMAAKQRDISVSEFFAKNRHLLGFDNPRKALLTAIKEAVDNSLDACEEAGILPNVDIK